MKTTKAAATVKPVMMTIQNIAVLMGPGTHVIMTRLAVTGIAVLMDKTAAMAKHVMILIRTIVADMGKAKPVIITKHAASVRASKTPVTIVLVIANIVTVMELASRAFVKRATKNCFNAVKYRILTGRQIQMDALHLPETIQLCVQVQVFLMHVMHMTSAIKRVIATRVSVMVNLILIWIVLARVLTPFSGLSVIFGELLTEWLLNLWVRMLMKKIKKMPVHVVTVNFKLLFLS